LANRPAEADNERRAPFSRFFAAGATRPLTARSIHLGFNGTLLGLVQTGGSCGRCMASSFHLRYIIFRYLIQLFGASMF